MTALWFLLGALMISAVGSAIIVLSQRKPSNEDWSVEEFRREMHALSPEARRVRRVHPGAGAAPPPRREPARAPRRGPDVARRGPPSPSSSPSSDQALDAEDRGR